MATMPSMTPDEALAAILARRERCDATVGEVWWAPGSGGPCGKRVVQCPCCGQISDMCADHLLEDPEFHPEYPEGVCAECYLTPTPKPQLMSVPPLRSAR